MVIDNPFLSTPAPHQRTTTSATSRDTPCASASTLDGIASNWTRGTTPTTPSGSAPRRVRQWRTAEPHLNQGHGGSDAPQSGRTPNSWAASPGVSLGTDRLRDADAFIAMRADDADDASSVGETEYDAASIVGERVSCSGRSLSQFNLGSDATERRESRSFQSLADEQKSDDEWVEGTPPPEDEVKRRRL